MSAYFVHPRKNVGSPRATFVFRRYPKLDVVCNTSNHFVLAFHAGRDLRLLALAHNTMILVIVDIYDAFLAPFLVRFMSCLLPWLRERLGLLIRCAGEDKCTQ